LASDALPETGTASAARTLIDHLLKCHAGASVFMVAVIVLTTVVDLLEHGLIPTRA
jgi:hypothetical protein